MTGVQRCQPTTATHSATPWVLVEANEHHGPYICNAWGGDVCDLYAMSNPLAASVRNGGDSEPVLFRDAEANAAFIVEAVNSYATLKARVAELEGALETAESEARRYAEMYPQSSDGRNTFIILADRITALSHAGPVARDGE
jgi:hypothetical protein